MTAFATLVDGAAGVAQKAGVTAAGQLSTAAGPVDPSAALLTYAAASAGTNSADQVNQSARGVKVVVDITAITGTTPTLTVTIRGKDPVSGKYFTLLASAALNAVATTVLTVYPGATASANVTANDNLPKTWRVEAVIGGTGPAVTVTIAAILLP